MNCVFEAYFFFLLRAIILKFRQKKSDKLIAVCFNWLDFFFGAVGLLY